MGATVRSKIWHRGIDTEFVCDTWDEARAECQRRFESAWVGEFANCQEIALTPWREQADDVGIEYRGREWHTTFQEQAQNGVWLVRPDDEPDEFRRVCALDPDAYARWYYTDPVGNLAFVCWQAWEE